MNWTLVLEELPTQWGKTDVTAETRRQEASQIDAWAPNAAETPEMSDNVEVIRPPLGPSVTKPSFTNSHFAGRANKKKKISINFFFFSFATLGQLLHRLFPVFRPA